MATTQLWTYKDLIESSLDFIGSHSEPRAQRDARRAVHAAYRDLATLHSWTYYHQVGRILTNASQTTGTITYTHTGGTYERQVTLASATWPSWAALGTLSISGVSYAIAERKTSTVVTLTAAANPGADVAAGTAYTLFRDTYPLPVDFLDMHDVDCPNAWSGLSYVHPRNWIAGRAHVASPGTPSAFTITGSDDYQGAMVLRFHPPPSTAQSVDYIYKRSPRELVVEDYNTSTATITSGTAALTGSSTAWKTAYAGSVLRLSSSATDYPTGRTGINPSAYERIILSVESATALTLDATVSETLTAVKYAISDPVDVEASVMLNALLRGIEYQLATLRGLKSKAEAWTSYVMALQIAKAQDSRYQGMRGVGRERSGRLPFKYHPNGSD